MRNTLQGGLDIAQWQSYEHMTMPLLESLVRDARAQALEAAATEGYFNAQIDVSIEEPQAGLRTVRLVLKPGEPARVENFSISLRGTQNPTLEAQVREQWSLTPGAIFRQSAWETAKTSSLATLSRSRYLGAAIAESRATVDPAKGTADLSLAFDLGPAFSFGPLTVTGLSKYPTETVTYLAPFKPGDPYTREDVELFLRRLNATNYFASAQLAVDNNRELADAAPVQVSVIEAPTRRLEAGVGYSTDTLYRATVAWRDVNLFDTAWRFRSELRLESKMQRLGTNLDLPARSDGWADSFDAAANRTDIQNLVTRGVVISATRRSIEERRQPAWGLSYYFEQQQPLGAPAEVARALFARYEYTRRTIDDLLFPRAGTVAALRLGVSAPGVSSETFGRAVGQLAWFHSLGQRDDIALRGELGAVIAPTSDGIPQALLFRSGGDTTVRGYAFESLGVQKGSAIVGGRYYALASAEYTHWFADRWGVAAFMDAGNAVDKLDGFRFATGYGIGVRVKSPIGPFRIDVARGQKTGEIRIHFSAGLAF